MRRWLYVLGIGVVVGGGIAAFLLKPVEGPARDLTLTANAEHGNYLIRLGGCVACHTDIAGGGAYLAGGVPLETPFGSFVPPNITSDKQAGIGAWSLEQFSEAMSNGMGPEGHLYPAFPYDSYTRMTDQDIVDLYAALQQVPPVADEPGEHELMFPFNIRLAMAGWQNLFFRPHRFKPDPDRSDRWNRGAYIVNGPGHCGTCHTPRNLLGAPETGQALAGSEGGITGTTADITTEALIAKGYDHDSLIEALTTGFTPGFDMLGGTMGEVITESAAHWSEDDLDAVAAYLLDED